MESISCPSMDHTIRFAIFFRVECEIRLDADFRTVANNLHQEKGVRFLSYFSLLDLALFDALTLMIDSRHVVHDECLVEVLNQCKKPSREVLDEILVPLFEDWVPAPCVFRPNL